MNAVFMIYILVALYHYIFGPGPSLYQALAWPSQNATIRKYLDKLKNLK